MPQNKHLRYAGFWIRFSAYLIDFVLLFFIFKILFGLQNMSLPQFFAYKTPDHLLIVLVMWLYFALQYASSDQATIGMRLVGVKVIDLDGSRLSLSRATLRHFTHYVSAFILFAGFILIAFTKRKQGLHDYLAGTYVVYEDS